MADFYELLKLIFSEGEIAGVALLTVILFAGLVVVIHWLIKDRTRLICVLSKRDQSLKDLIDKYEKSQMANVNAINTLKEVLIELKTIIEYKSK